MFFRITYHIYISRIYHISYIFKGPESSDSREIFYLCWNKSLKLKKKLVYQLINAGQVSNQVEENNTTRGLLTSLVPSNA